ncbi:hypothetical protein O181_100271 [Austropuccinia psidii MF-1]|uniref:Uncharacterized protein n=1 Tax=Austropuccinia psidii MF-1 TaxID=1389203 RepID=A0A9Q3PHN0_9BASI|nr:hypothetical protein [Austropuccinia psidii MF-1]
MYKTPAKEATRPREFSATSHTPQLARGAREREENDLWWEIPTQTLPASAIIGWDFSNADEAEANPH